ncbi:hypothetical protein BDQ12DRAFT_690095 [Crucibulum laeve]|uniref:Uncharacterized protein n=1 Tax=Crucibulum laeve TaxID=68775 RepID=A0A5C3LPK1_9AGAR|nr:hypothetical protein BDQ12DRAFT_690095 [Crucibulum laeve]
MLGILRMQRRRSCLVSSRFLPSLSFSSTCFLQEFTLTLLLPQQSTRSMMKSHPRSLRYRAILQTSRSQLGLDNLHRRRADAYL